MTIYLKSWCAVSTSVFILFLKSKTKINLGCLINAIVKVSNLMKICDNFFVHII